MPLEVSLYRKSMLHQESAIDAGCLLCLNDLYSVFRMQVSDERKLTLIPEVLSAAGHKIAVTNSPMTCFWKHRPSCEFIQVWVESVTVEVLEPEHDPIVITAQLVEEQHQDLAPSA